MRTFLAILLLTAGLTARAQLNYASTNTQQIITTLPTVLNNSDGSVTYRPTTNMLVAAGWLWITYIQPPSNGYAMTGNYLVTSTNQAYGTCSLRITSQYNLAAAAATAQAASDLVLSNAWRGTAFLTNCQAFRTTLRAFGTTETNAVVNGDTMSTWLAGYAMTNTITPQLGAQLQFMAQMYPQLLLYGTNTATFPWRLIP